MSISLPSKPRCLAVLLVLVTPLLPTCNEPVERSADLDVELVRSAECEYKGIRASFEEISHAYAISVYRQADLVGWEARPSPPRPEAEALVTATFAVAGLQDSPPASWGKGPRLRSRVRNRVAVTWRLNTMGGIRIAPHDDYARDAVEVFRETVNGFLGRMVYLTEAAALRSEPASTAGAVVELDIGQVLLRERREGEWIYARVPSSRAVGWVDGNLVQRVDDQ